MILSTSGGFDYWLLGVAIATGSSGVLLLWLLRHTSFGVVNNPGADPEDDD